MVFGSSSSLLLSCYGRADSMILLIQWDLLQMSMGIANPKPSCRCVWCYKCVCGAIVGRIALPRSNSNDCTRPVLLSEESSYREDDKTTAVLQ